MSWLLGTWMFTGVFMYLQEPSNLRSAPSAVRLAAGRVSPIPARGRSATPLESTVRFGGPHTGGNGMYQANSIAVHGDPPRIEKFVGDPVLARREARWLAQAVHPGVVRLLRWNPDRQTIDTELIAGPTLRTAALVPDDAALALSSLARTVADLHERGFVHANLSPDHLLVDGARANGSPRLVLCSPKGQSPTDRAGDEGRFGAHPDLPREDWVGFQRCVRWLIEEWRGRNVRVPAGWQDLADHPAPLRRTAYRLDQLVTRRGGRWR